MKTKLSLAVLLISASLAGAQDNTIDRLRKGILEEDTNHNLDKAIEAYQSILKQFDQERPTAATALFRLAECYRKQGRANQAASAYQRVIREFNDHSKLAELSRAQLSKTSGNSQTQPAAPSDRKTQLRSPQEQRLDELRFLLKEMETRYAPNHPDVLHIRSELRKLEKIVNARQKYRSLLEDEIRLVEEQIQGEQRKFDAGVADSDRMTKLRRDILTLQRALAAIDAGTEPLPLPALPTRP